MVIFTMLFFKRNPPSERHCKELSNILMINYLKIASFLAMTLQGTL